MNLPKKRRGFRRIVADSINYDWRFDTRSDKSASVDIRLVAKPRSKLLIDIDWQDPWLNMRENIHHRYLLPCSYPISPKFVVNAIRVSKKLGWQPNADYNKFHIKYRSGKFLKD